MHLVDPIYLKVPKKKIIRPNKKKKYIFPYIAFFIFFVIMILLLYFTRNITNNDVTNNVVGDYIENNEELKSFGEDNLSISFSNF